MHRSLKRTTEEQTHREIPWNEEGGRNVNPRVRAERDDGPEATVRRRCGAH